MQKTILSLGKYVSEKKIVWNLKFLKMFPVLSLGKYVSKEKSIVWNLKFLIMFPVDWIVMWCEMKKMGWEGDSCSRFCGLWVSYSQAAQNSLMMEMPCMCVFH